ncbi:glycosyl hydrolase [Echinimonas agarilytica]|uniref:GH26 domain-containing protein n=1 Tax=Echinimonas agarilytica TaxID=1215918 RepID=A0AA41W4C5_9GAMM|nr:glycosyl hydrolase [Echinimonas agarilytica]MCM2678694.1 hypothetical protein [Echinimonas agarilytica]
MKFNIGDKSSVTLLTAALVMGGVTGCVDDGSVNNDNHEYTPEERPLGVVAGEDGEFEPGAEITVSGRLVGTITDQTVLWTQTAGKPLEGIDWTQPEFTFVVEEVDGIESYEFKIEALDIDGNVVEDADGMPLSDDVKITVFDPDEVITLEAEDARFTDGLEVATSGHEMFIANASGDAHLTDMLPGTEVVFDVEMDADSAGLYSLYLNYAIGSGYGGKQGTVTVNGVEYALDLQETGKWEELRVGTVKFEEGTTEVIVCCGWNYYRVDAIKLVPSSGDAPLLPVPATLVNENATDEAVALMEFLASEYGAKTITGQTEFMNYGEVSQTGLREYNKVVAATGGAAPAIVAFDYMDFSTSRSDNGKTPGTLTEDMLAEQAAKNVVLSALWHWAAPSGHPDGEIGSFYTDGTTFDLAAAMADTSSAEYADLIADMDVVAAELKKLQDAGIPVIWRPIHEAEGGWFWWGAAGADAFKELWMLMYDRFTTTHGLNNLIWAFTNTEGLGEEWYPGDEFVDIVGYDGYDGVNDQNAFISQFSTLKDRHNGKKLLALTETGTIPDVEKMHELGAFWNFFITWNTDEWNTPPTYGPGATDPAVIAANYGYKELVNNDDLPGGVAKAGAGTLNNFDRTEDFEVQVNWGATTGLTYSSEWSKYGDKSLSVTKDISAIDTPENVVIQTYPGIAITDQTTLTVTAYAMNAGATVNAHLFVKGIVDGDPVEQWPAAVDLSGAPVELTLDITGYEEVSGYGVRFQGLDGTTTEATFFIDSVMLGNAEGMSVLQDFENTGDVEGQVNWGPAPGLATSKEWSTSGQQSIAMFRDLTEVTEPTDVIIQVYPEGGIDVSEYDSIAVDATALNAGSAQVMLFIKDAGDNWVDSGAVDADDVTLTVDLTSIDTLNGYGIRFIGFDATSTDAKFFADQVRFSNAEGDMIHADFEQVDMWEAQLNWSPTTGITPSEDWGVDNTSSMSIMKDLTASDTPENVVMQTYPALQLEDDVTTLKLTAYAADAGADVNVHLFVKGIKDDAPVEQWPAAVNVNGAPVELMLDVTGYSEISGYGVRFQGLDATSTAAKFYVDHVVLEAAAAE